MTMHVLCFKWGTKYGPEYVNRLYAMVERNLSLSFAFHCFTDDNRGIRSGVECHSLPQLDCPVPVNVPGSVAVTVAAVALCCGCDCCRSCGYFLSAVSLGGWQF